MLVYTRSSICLYKQTVFSLKGINAFKLLFPKCPNFPKGWGGQGWKFPQKSSDLVKHTLLESHAGRMTLREQGQGGKRTRKEEEATFYPETGNNQIYCCIRSDSCKKLFWENHTSLWKESYLQTQSGSMNSLSPDVLHLTDLCKRISKFIFIFWQDGFITIPTGLAYSGDVRIIYDFCENDPDAVQ